MSKPTITDELLSENMRKIEIMLLDSLPKEEDLSHEFSKTFEKKMNKLIREQKRTPFMRSFITYGKRAAAIFFIIVGISFVTTMSVEAYRVKFFEIITEVWEEFTSVRYSTENGITDTILEPITPEYIPEGFTIIEEELDDYGNRIIYENIDNDEIFYEQRVMSNGVIIFDTEGITVQTMEIEGQEINYFTNKGVSQVYWNNYLYIFTLHSTIGEEEIIKIARSVIESK